MRWAWLTDGAGAPVSMHRFTRKAPADEADSSEIILPTPNPPCNTLLISYNKDVNTAFLPYVHYMLK